MHHASVHIRSVRDLAGTVAVLSLVLACAPRTQHLRVSPASEWGRARTIAIQVDSGEATDYLIGLSLSEWAEAAGLRVVPRGTPADLDVRVRVRVTGLSGTYRFSGGGTQTKETGATVRGTITVRGRLSMTRRFTGDQAMADALVYGPTHAVDHQPKNAVWEHTDLPDAAAPFLVAFAAPRQVVAVAARLTRTTYKPLSPHLLKDLVDGLLGIADLGADDLREVGVFLEEAGLDAEAIPFLRRAQARKPDDPATLLALASALPAGAEAETLRNRADTLLRSAGADLAAMAARHSSVALRRRALSLLEDREALTTIFCAATDEADKHAALARLSARGGPVSARAAACAAPLAVATRSDEQRAASSLVHQAVSLPVAVEPAYRRHLPALLRALGEPPEERQLAALQVLGWTHEPSAFAPVLRLAASGKGELAAKALATLPSLPVPWEDERQPRALLDVYRKAAVSPEDEVREAAYEGLGQLRTAEAVPILLEAFAKDRAWPQKEAARALGRMGVRQAVVPLLLWNTDQNGQGIRAEALAAIDRGWTWSREAADAVPALMKKLGAGDACEAAGLLGRIGDARAVPALLQARRRASYPGCYEEALGHIDARWGTRPGAKLARTDLAAGDGARDLAALRADYRRKPSIELALDLARQGSTEGLDQLIATLDGKESYRSHDAIRAMGALTEPRARQALRRALRDRGSRRVAAEAMQRAGGADFVPDLLASLAVMDRDSPSETILLALQALDPKWRGRREAEEVRRKARLALASPQSEAPCAVLSILAELDPRQGFNELVARVEKWGVHRCLIGSIRASRDRRLVPALLGSLADDEAVRALDRIEPGWRSARARPAIAAPYVTRLANRDSGDRVRALIALARLGTVASTDPVAAALADPDPHVRAEAVRCLQILEGERARARLQLALRDPSELVRVAAARILFPLP